MDSIKSRVFEIIKLNFAINDSVLNEDTELKSVFGSDDICTDSVDFLRTLEREFSINIDNDTFTSFKKIGDIIDFVNNNIKKVEEE